MKQIKSALGGALLISLVSAPALAQSTKTPEELATEGLGKIISALELFMTSIPQYELPEVQPNGDILIRRKNGTDRDGQKSDKSIPEDPDRENSI